MAHFAEIDENNKVLRVIVVNNEVITVDGVENEQVGKDFCSNLFGGNWIQSSYHGNFRQKAAGIGDYYDPINDIFITVDDAN